MVKLHAAELVLSPHTPKSSAFIVAVLDTCPVFQGPSKHDAWNPRACWSKLGAWFPQLILSNTIWKDAELTWNDNNNEKKKLFIHTSQVVLFTSMAVCGTFCLSTLVF